MKSYITILLLSIEYELQTIIFKKKPINIHICIMYKVNDVITRTFGSNKKLSVQLSKLI